MDPLLYGHNTEERIVAVHQTDDRTMRLYFRDGEQVRTRDERFYPFFFLSEPALIEGFPREHWVKKLEGPGYYRYLCAFEEWPVLWEAIRHVIDRYNRGALTKVESYTDLDAIYFQPDPVTHFLMQSGRTLFKGMTFEQLHRLQLDIETYTSPPHKFSNASRPGDRIILIALADNAGWSHLIDGKKLSEPQMLAELTRIIRERDPDVIEGHNIFNFDLPYLLARAAMHGIPLGIGRDGSAPRTFDARTSFAEHPFEYTVTEIAGRHVIDTMLLLQSYDASKRTLESYGLKYAAQYFGFASPDRTYIKGDRISWHWDNDVRPLMAYALDDVIETGKLSAHLSMTPFYLAQMLPFAYGTVARLGSAGKIESLIVREYLRLKCALPRPQMGTQTSGGYTDVFLIGILGPIVHADVESLYPSIMITKRIGPSSDGNGVFSSLLSTLTAMRLDAKKAMKKVKEPVERSRLDAIQSSMKILVNSFYGYLGYSRALFNDYQQADAVTQTGQQLLRQMLSFIQADGGKVIEVDTDGVFFVPPERIDEEADQRAFVDSLSRRMPEGITVAFDGRYRKMMSYKKKNYALLEYDARIQIKGSSLISRSMEQFGRTYIQRCITELLNGNLDTLHQTYLQYRRSILDHAMDVADFAKVESLKDPLQVYSEEVKAGKRNRSAAYEVALNSGRQYRQGDRIAFYITGNDPNARSFENCKGVDEWDPNFPDENTRFYLRRLDEFSEKFAPLFSPGDFRAVFSSDDLFPFDPAKILLLISEAVEKEPPDASEGIPSQFGIWIDE